MSNVTSIDFDHPDETRSFPHGKWDFVRVGTTSVGRGTLEPGWRWKTDVKPLAGTETCQLRHVGTLLSGRLKVQMEDGSEAELAAGQAYVIEPGHDAWTVGDEPAVALEFSTVSAETYAKPA